MATVKKTLKRKRQFMPAFVRSALVSEGLMEAYRSRPPYQKNDYLAWIKSAKLEPTREKRLAQMLAELKGGKKYMNTAWAGEKP